MGNVATPTPDSRALRSTPNRTMVPDVKLRPQVLPTDRLLESGLAVPALRSELRRISSARNAITVLGAYLQAFGPLVLVDRVVDRTGYWWLWIPMFIVQGRAHSLFGILSHEGAHRLLFASQRMNDLVATWLIAPLGFTSQDGYRRSHMAHHRDPLGENEPDKRLYFGYPVSRETLRRRLRRDIDGESGYKLVKGLLRSLSNKKSRPATLRILGVNAILAIALALAVNWWAWALMWFVPWLTVWRVLARLRAIAEHGGMANSKDERVTTHHVRQSRLARFWIVPYHTGWHVAHHVDAGIPWRNLPRFHEELVGAGYIAPGLEYRSYTSLWRALASG